jgi:hypothetical protein
MKQTIQLFAGKKAYNTIRNRGLDPDSVRVILGAAGGPKWLVLDGLDRAIFFSLLKKTEQEIHLIGSSIGAWRFAALAGGETELPYDRFQHAYIHQHYSEKPSAKDVTEEALRILDEFLDKRGETHILSHPRFRLHMIAVRSRTLFDTEHRPGLILGMVGAATANFFSRKLLSLFFTRTLFSDPRAHPPLSFSTDHIPTRSIPLTSKNIRDVILASGSIPVVMEGVSDISGAPRGLYRDGGLIDYHHDMPFSGLGDNDIILYPHYTRRITPGWFDKHLPWWAPVRKNLEHVLQVSPSPSFIETLPYGKIPERSDFTLFRNRDKERIVFWESVASESMRLRDDFLEIAFKDSLADFVLPLYP